MRKTVIGVLAALLVLGLVVVLLPRLVPLDFLKPRIVAALEERTGREVDFGRLSLSLLPGIGVKVADLTMSGGPRHPGEDLLSVPEAEIRMALLPLFQRRAVFTKVILRRPAVRFYRYADGTTSLSGIADRLTEAEEEPVPEERDAVAFDLRSLRIEEAGLLLVLESEDGEETRWEITPLDVRLSGLGRDRRSFDVSTRVSGAVRGEISLAGTLAEGPADGAAAYDLRGEGKAFGQPVTVEGVLSVPPDGEGADLTLTLPKIAMDGIPGVFATPPPWLADLSLSGAGRLTARVSGNLESAGFTAEADLTQAGFSAGPGFRKPTDIPLTVVVQGRRLPDRILISNAEVRSPPLVLIANAAYVPSTGAREWKASARIPQLSELVLSSDGGLAPYAPSGRLEVSAQGERPSTEAQEGWQATLALGGVGFRLPDRGYEFEGLEGRVEGSPRAVSFQPLAGLLNGQRFSLRGPVGLGPLPKERLDFRMAYLDIDALLPPGGEEGPQAQHPSREEAPGESREVAARVGVQVDAGKVRGVEFRDLRGTAVYEKGNITLDSMRARVFDGSVGLSGRIGLTGPDPDFRVSIKGEKLAAGDVLSRHTSLRDFLTGTSDLSLEIGGEMGGFADFARTASGAGSIHVTGGTIKGIDLLTTAIDLADLDAILPAARETRTAAARGETRFRDLSADFRLDGGKIRTDSLRIASDAMGLAGTAAIGLDRTLEFRGTLRLSPDLSAQARGITGTFLLDPAGRVEIPLVVSGNLTSPAIAVDTEAVARGAGERLRRELLERIPIPRDAEPRPGAPDNAEKAPERPDAEDAIRGLFERLLPGKK
jgi:hypothetical protein